MNMRRAQPFNALHFGRALATANAEIAVADVDRSPRIVRVTLRVDVVSACSGLEIRAQPDNMKCVLPAGHAGPRAGRFRHRVPPTGSGCGRANLPVES